MTIRGTISANGHYGEYAYKAYAGSGGTGGSVLIDAKRLITDGAVITANGGAASGDGGYGGQPGGTGGRIALKYDTSAQQAGDIGATTKVWAAPEHNKVFSTCCYDNDSQWSRPGTVWVPDAMTLSTLLASGSFCGEPIVGTGDGCATVSTINLTSGYLVFGNSLTNVTVTGDVNLNGNDVRLCFGANKWVTAYTFTSPDVPFTFKVGGDFNLTLGARADLFAAPTNGLGVARGAFVNVTGDFNVLGRAKDDALGLDERITYVYPACNPTNGAGVRISAKNVTVNEKGRISSDTRGFIVDSSRGVGRGPGGGRSWCEGITKCWGIGAGHGGRGAHGSKASGYDVYGLAYDDPRRPMLAGSSGTQGGSFTGLPGGGIVHLVANNLMTLAGAVSADSGVANFGSNRWGDGTAGSGGSILLEASKFSAAATASFSAKGSSAPYDCTQGAGGCISVWIGAPGCGFDEVKSYAALETSEVFGAATVSVAAGSTYILQDEGEFFAAEAGTVTAYQATPLGQNLIVQTYDEASFGTTEPAYGAHAVSVGATATVTATDVVRADNVRSRATGYTIETLNEDGTWSAPVAYEGSVCSFEMDEKTYRVTWKWTLEAKLTIEAGEHGSVTPSAPPKDAGWYALGSTATLTPAAESGYGFAYWTGVSHLQIQESPCLLVMDAAKTVTPHFQVAPAGGLSFVWSGAGGNKLWLNPSNWTPNGLPIAGDRVSFPETASASAFTVLLDAATAPLSSLTVPANVTLMTTNWMTKIVASTVTVQNGGTVTCAGPFADRVTTVVPEIQMSNRVWIVCTDLTVDAGGKIDVTAKGFGDSISSQQGRSYGPGRAIDNHKSAASHGGLGKDASNAPYGSVDEPEEPGSSGGGISGNLKSYPSVACAGGGVIRIDATGTVTVNGTVTANGRQSTDYMGAGSGGSVLIYAQKIAANGGTILTKGGGSTGRGGAYGGAGGRVALHYDTTAQQTAALDDLTIDVGPGQRSDCNYPGTLWTTDNQLLKFLNDGKVAAEIVVGHEGKVTLDALTINATDVRFGGEVTNVTVLGNMRMTGAKSRLAFGATTWEKTYPTDGYTPFTSAAGRPFVLTVGGDLLMEAGSFVEFHAAPTNGLGGAFGGYVKVGGLWTIASNATVYTRCERNTGAAFSFAARNMTIETNAVLSADYSGFPGVYNTAAVKHGHGPGGGYSGGNYGQGDKTSGGGYGGDGGLHGTVPEDWTYGKAYGDANRPMFAGSAGSADNGTSECNGVAGGGFIHLDVSGRLTIGGTVTANGATARARNASGTVYSYSTGASGGAILIDAHKLTLEPGAVLSAKGGNNNSKSGGNTVPAGGGGRIAVWLGSHWTPDYRVRADNILDPATVIPEGVTVTAAGGVTPTDLYHGEDGTIRFINCISRGMAIIIR